MTIDNVHGMCVRYDCVDEKDVEAIAIDGEDVGWYYHSGPSGQFCIMRFASAWTAPSNHLSLLPPLSESMFVFVVMASLISGAERLHVMSFGSTHVHLKF